MENDVFTGKVVQFNIKKGFGFIKWEKNGVAQKDMFVHFSAIQCDNFKALYKDQTVTFQIGKNKNNDPVAVNVKVLTN